MREMSVKKAMERYAGGDVPFITSIQREMDKATGVLTLQLVKPEFIIPHPVSKRPFGELFDLMVDAVKTTVQNKISAIVYPVDMAHDGTLTLIESQIIKATRKPDFSNWGSDRLGISVTCGQVNPLGFRVVVGPFFELKKGLEEAVAEME